MCEWSGVDGVDGVDTPQTVMTTRAPAVLKINFLRNVDKQI